MGTVSDRLKDVYQIKGADEARRFYDAWAGDYDAEMERQRFVTPRRCAEALKQCAGSVEGVVADLGCGTGLAGLALSETGFKAIDGFDLSEGMLEKARAKSVYRNLGTVDLSKPDALPQSLSAGPYDHAVAVGVLSPDLMPVNVIDKILDVLNPSGVFVFSINEHHAADGMIDGRVMELTDCGYADLLMREKGEHLPGIELESTVYAMRKH
ncbi:MAG: methyltransferase domain-containing protein [Pseudomonadota bacterium]